MSKIQHLLDIQNTLSSGKNETTPAIDATSAHCDQSTESCLSVPAVVKAPAGSVSYAKAVTANLSETVKAAVFETIRNQRTEERGRASVAIYGLPKKGNDYDGVRNLFQALNEKSNIVSVARIGRGTSRKVSSNLRPLKVELQSKYERSSLLSAASKLKEDPRTASIRIAPWLQKDEFDKVKALREHCKQLNSSAAPTADGRKPFFVISGKLMTRNANGKLQLHIDAVSNKAEIADNDIKSSTGATVNEDGKLTHVNRAQADTGMNTDQNKTPSSTVMADANDPSAKKGSSVSAFQHASAAATAMQSSDTKQPQCESKKRIGRVSCGTLQAIGKVATEVSHLSPREVKEKNDSVNKQLQNNNMYSVNVAGDGNCFF